MKYKYVNNYTGELYSNLFSAFKCIIFDIIHYPKCRTIKIFNLKKGNL